MSGLLLIKSGIAATAAADANSPPVIATARGIHETGSRSAR
jgi:hypothetical protein